MQHQVNNLMLNPEILIVARQTGFAKSLTAWLQEAGYPVINAFNGVQGLWEFLQHRPAFVVLEVPARQEESYDLLTRIREVSQVPVILLSCRGTEADKVRGLSLGADDYLVQPVGQRELLARIETILRRASNDPAEAEAFYDDGVVTMDFARHCVYVLGEEVPLTSLEYQLLKCLTDQSGQVLTQQRLLDGVWGPEYDGCEYVKWHISRLRRKIEQDPENPKLVVTVRGVGYRYDAPTDGHRLHPNGKHLKGPMVGSLSFN